MNEPCVTYGLSPLHLLLSLLKITNWTLSYLRVTLFAVSSAWRFLQQLFPGSPANAPSLATSWYPPCYLLLSHHTVVMNNFIDFIICLPCRICDPEEQRLCWAFHCWIFRCWINLRIEWVNERALLSEVLREGSSVSGSDREACSEAPIIITSSYIHLTL